MDLAAQKPEIFSLLSQHLASLHKVRNHRTTSIDSIGPESPIFPKDSSFHVSSPVGTERNNNSGGTEYQNTAYSGFNPVRSFFSFYKLFNCCKWCC